MYLLACSALVPLKYVFVHNTSILQNSSDCGEVFNGGVEGVHPDYLRAEVEFLATNTRSPQILHEEHPVVRGLEKV